MRTQQPRLQVGESAQRVDEAAGPRRPVRPDKGERHRVHGEVAPYEILLDGRAVAYLGQRAGPCVALRAQLRDVEVVRRAIVYRFDRGGAESRLGTHGVTREALSSSDPPRKPTRVTVSGEIDFAGHHARRDVAYGTAHRPQLTALLARGRDGGVEQPPRT